MSIPVRKEKIMEVLNKVLNMIEEENLVAGEIIKLGQLLIGATYEQILEACMTMYPPMACLSVYVEDINKLASQLITALLLVMSKEKQN